MKISFINKIITSVFILFVICNLTFLTIYIHKINKNIEAINKKIEAIKNEPIHLDLDTLTKNPSIGRNLVRDPKFIE